MATIPKPPQISPINRKASSGIESDLASLSPLSRKPPVEPFQTYSRKESQNIQRSANNAKIKDLLSKKASKNSALAITRHQEGDNEPEIPRMVDYSSTYDLPQENLNRSKYTIYKKEHSFGDKQYNLFGSIFRHGSAAQNNSFYSRETGYIQDVQQARFKEQRVQAPDCLEMDMRPGAMFQIAKEASQRSFSQGRTGLHIRYQKNTTNQRGNSSETADLGKSFEAVQTFRKSISKERPRPVENKNQIILPRLEKKVTVQVQEEVLTNRNNQYLVTPSAKKAEPREISPQTQKNKKDNNYPIDILERRNTTDPGYDETPTSPFIRKIYSRGDNSAFITPRRKNNSTLLAPYEDSSSLQQSPEMNQTFDEEYFPLVNKKERLPRAKLSGIEVERNRSGFHKDASGGFQVGTNSYFDAKYSWTKAISNDIRQKPGYNSKSRNIKGIDHLLRLKTRIGHQEKMREYLRRRGLNENTKVFCFNSKDMHIKRILEGLGWVENPNIDSPLFDLKWAYRDLDNYQLLSEGQYFNHFGNNQALTMKSELMKNLRDNRDYGNEWSFFPRAYELTHEGQIKEFREDFDRTMIENLIKKLWDYIKGRCDRKMIQNAKVKFWTRQKTEEERKSNNAKKIEEKKFGKESQQKKIKMFRKHAKQNITKTTKVKQQTKWDEISFGEAQRREDFLMHAELVIQTLRCIRTLVKQQKAKGVMEDNDCYAVSDLPKRIQEALLKYSQADHFNIRIIEEIKTAPEIIHSIWKTPNQDIVNLIYKYYSLLKLVFPQFKIDGSKNIWIVKPGGNSKGSGIFLINTLEEALENRTRHQSRIIQKYIEKPLILRDFPIPDMNGKKFDLRQWVLVTSINPLTVYMFSSCYLRICSIDFDLQDLKNSYRHLTNFSVNKQKYGKSAENSVCRVEYLKDYLKYNRNIEWDSYIKPQIINIINKTLACVSDELDQRSGCFELYGFDILLDETCKAWLLEVNLSPACSERASWLMHMLDQMGLEMLKLVLPANYLGDVDAYMSKERAYDNDDASFEDNDSRHMRWELISKDDAAKETKEIIVNPNIAFEVVGAKLNWKKDYLFDSKHNCYRLMVILQKNIKAFLFRKSIQRKIRNTKAKVIQRRVRRFLARVRYTKRMQLRAFETMKKFIMKSLKAKFFTRFIQTNASVVIQRHVRHRQKYLKERRKKGLKRLEGGLAKYFGRRLICGLIYAKAAVTIQRYVRERQRCRREKREKGFAILRIMLLKHTWKKLLKKVQLEKAAITIQKQFRGWKTRKSYKEKQKEIENDLKDSNAGCEKDEAKNEEYLNADSQQTSIVSTKSSKTNKEELELDDNRNC